MMKRNRIKRLLTGLLTVAMVTGSLSVSNSSLTVYAEEENAQAVIKNVNLDTSYLAPSEATWDTTNDYKVYFGQYDGSPTAFRVLQVVDGKMFLDCDTTLLSMSFDDDKAVNEGQTINPNEWLGSDLQEWLNGSEYYENTSVFSAVEKAAIKETVLLASEEDYEAGQETYKDYAATDHVFLLSAREANDLYMNNTVRKKTGKSIYWWLRSADYINYVLAGFVDSVGNIMHYGVDTNYFGVCPAINLNLSSVLFASANGMNKSSSFALTTDSTDKVWNITLAGGNGFTAVVNTEKVVPNGTVIVNVSDLGTDLEGNVVANDYYSQLSAMLADENGTVLAYGKIADSAVMGEVYVTLPQEVGEGNYTLKIFAEKVNSSDSNHVTDYASNMVTVPLAVSETVDYVELVMNEPIAGTTLNKSIDATRTDVEAQLEWLKRNSDGTYVDVNGNAAYNNTYKAMITLSVDTANHIQFADTVTVKVNGVDITPSDVKKKEDGTLTVAKEFTLKAKLLSIIKPSDITGIANGTAKTAVALGLPGTVTIVTEDVTVTSADVTWDLNNPASGSYDPLVRTEQTFTVNGAVKLPESIDANGIDPKVQITVTVLSDHTDPGIISKPWPFTDIPELPGYWKYDNVKYVYDRDIMNGIAGTTLFDPDGQLNRAMFATVLYRMAGSPEIEFEDIFPDVENGKYYSSAVMWVKEKGIAQGLGDGSYGVTVNITREQIAKMLYEYASKQGYDVSGRSSLDFFTDKDVVNDWAVDYMQWAVNAGMITGKPNDDGSFRLDPKGDATRAECAKMLAMFLKKYEPNK